MDLNEILQRTSLFTKKTDSYISLTTGNSPAVWKIIEKLSLRELQLIRSLHLELTLEPSSPDSLQEFLLDHIDHNLSQLMNNSFTALKHDRNTEKGFENRPKMKKLLE
jgi:hypothetical protein